MSNYSIYSESFEDLSKETDKEIIDTMQRKINTTTPTDCSAIYFSSALRLKLYAIIYPVPKDPLLISAKHESDYKLYSPFLARREAFSYLWSELPVVFCKDFPPRAFLEACAYYIAVQEHRFAEKLISASEYHYRTVRTRVILKEFGADKDSLMRFYLNVVTLYELLYNVLSLSEIDHQDLLMGMSALREGKEISPIGISMDLFDDRYNKYNIRMDHPMPSNMEKSDKWPLTTEDLYFIEEAHRFNYDKPIKVNLIEVIRSLAICSVFLLHKKEDVHSKIMEVIEDHDLTKEEVIEYSGAMMNRFKVMLEYVGTWE